MNAALGRLERVELRDVWSSEDQDFTPWLAREENLLVLAETIGMELELEATEKEVGPFRADILCKDVADDRLVLIENQLERTDHRHLGQLLTYAAGLEAVTIVWVAARFEEQHRAAMAWLNQITDRDFRFFALEVELWRIGSSTPAPKFNIVAQPNNWSRAVGRAARGSDSETLSETKQQQERYWTALIDHLDRNGIRISAHRARPQHWQNFAVGRSGFRLTTKVNSRDNIIGVELFIHAQEAKAFFALLAEQREAIEQAFKQALSWEELPERIGCRIAIYRTGVDPTDEANWLHQHEWMSQNLRDLDRVFRPRIKQLDPDSWAPAEEDDQDQAA